VDPSVSPRSVSIARSNFIKQFWHCHFPVLPNSISQVSSVGMAYIEISGETLSLVSPPRVVLSPCYYAFCEWLDGLCLCEGRGDGFVDDEGRDEIAEDRVALALGSSDQTTEVLAEGHIGAPALSRDAMSPAPRPPCRCGRRRKTSTAFANLLVSRDPESHSGRLCTKPRPRRFCTPIHPFRHRRLFSRATSEPWHEHGPLSAACSSSAPSHT